MRYFKLINGDGWTDYQSGVIYKGTTHADGDEGNIQFYATKGLNPEDWQEVSEEEYLKQEGKLSEPEKINLSFYEKEFALTIESIKNKLWIKGEEYSTSTDKFHNFNEGAIRLKCTPERCLEAYNTKHLVSYSDILDGLDKGIVPSDEYIDEKLGDIINYFILQKIQLKQRNNDMLPR